MNCGQCKHEGPKYWSRGDEEEMRSYCFINRIYEPYKPCEHFEQINDNKNELN